MPKLQVRGWQGPCTVPGDRGGSAAGGETLRRPALQGKGVDLSLDLW